MLTTEFSTLRPSSFDAPKFMQKAKRVLHKIRDVESASVIQQSFENKDPRPVYQFFMAILDHYERMYTEVIRPAYIARLKGDDIHSVPLKLNIKALFLRMAVMWEAKKAQSKHQQFRYVFYKYPP